MKKFLITLLILFCTKLGVNAETITGTALSDFSTENPVGTFTVKINEGFTVDNYKHYKAGTVFYGKVEKVVNGQIGKRKGYFVFTPTHYANQDDVHQLTTGNLEIKVSYYKPFDKEQAMKNLTNLGLTTAAGKILHVPFLSEGISFVKGTVSPEEDTNRIISGVKSAYKSSPLVYVEKGEELYVHPGQEVKLNINE